MNIELPDSDIEVLADYLRRHEEEIAADIDDYGDLASLFEVVIGRVALEYP